MKRHPKVPLMPWGQKWRRRIISSMSKYSKLLVVGNLANEPTFLQEVSSSPCIMWIIFSTFNIVHFIWIGFFFGCKCRGIGAQMRFWNYSREAINGGHLQCLTRSQDQILVVVEFLYSVSWSSKVPNKANFEESSWSIPKQMHLVRGGI